MSPPFVLRCVSCAAVHSLHHPYNFRNTLKVNTLNPPPANTPDMLILLGVLRHVPHGAILVRMKHSEWVDTLTEGATTRAIGDKLDIAHTTIARQIKAEKLSPEMVIDLCRAFGKLPVDGLLETGYLEYGDIEGAGIPQALRWATNRQLLGEINRRSEPEATRLFGKSPELINPVVATDAQVFNFPAPEQEEEFEPERYVAKRKQVEPSEGDDDFGA